MAVKAEAPRKKSAAQSKGKKREAPAAGKHLKITLVRSLIGRPHKQREVVKGLGLRKLNSEVIREDCPATRGMINKVPHLIKVEELKRK